MRAHGLDEDNSVPWGRGQHAELQEQMESTQHPTTRRIQGDASTPDRSTLGTKAAEEKVATQKKKKILF